MNTSLSWIKAYVPELNCTPQEYTDAMTLSGTKVENYTCQDADLEKIVVGQIESIVRHPDADKLVVCQVNVGTEPDEGLMKKLMEALLRTADVDSLGETPEGVELACRKGREQNYLFVMNHTEVPQMVSLGKEWEVSEVSLPPYGFIVVGSEEKELE